MKHYDADCIATRTLATSTDRECLICSGQSVAAAAVRTLVGDSAGVCGRDGTAVRRWWLSHQVIRRPRAGLQVVVLPRVWPMVQAESPRAIVYTR